MARDFKVANCNMPMSKHQIKILVGISRSASEIFITEGARISAKVAHRHENTLVAQRYRKKTM